MLLRKARLWRQPQTLAKANDLWRPSAAWNFANTVEAVSRKPVTLSAAAGGVVTPGGKALRVVGTGSFNRAILNSSGADDIGDGDFTAIIRLILRGNLADSYVALGRWSGGGNPTNSDWYLGAGNSFTGNTVDFGVASSTAANGASATVSGWSLGAEYTLVGRRRGQTIFVDRFTGGVNTGSGTLTSGTITTINYTSSLNLGLGEFAASSAFNLDSDTSFVGLFPRCLSDSEVARLALNPWQVFTPQKRRLWVADPTALGPPPPTLSAFSFTNITATTARPQVSVTY